MGKRQGGWALLVVLVLSGCASSPPTPRAHSAQASSSSSTTTAATASAADLVACKAYLRQAPQDDLNVTDVTTKPTPIFLIVDTFKTMGDGLESGTVTATDPELVTALHGTVAGIRSAQATASAWTDGSTLDLNPDVTATYQASSKVAQICSILDPSSSYTPIGTVQ